MNIQKHVVIIGGGAAGVLTLKKILESDNKEKFKITLIERNADSLAKGPAYITKSPFHLLNVRASAMTIDASCPNDFVDWLKENSYPSSPDSFVPRSLFGSYLSSTLNKLLSDFSERVNISIQNAIDIKCNNDSYEVQLEDSSKLKADYVVLAVGNFAPVSPSFISSEVKRSNHYNENPWGFDAKKILQQDEIGIIGAGLTAVDVMIDLLSLGYKGKIHVISRNGKLPQTHLKQILSSVTPPSDLLLNSNGIREKIKIFRKWISSENIDWRAALDSLRPHTQALWSNFSLKDKETFLRHCKIFWETHRHRMAPELYEMIKGGVDTKQIMIHAGKISNVSVDKENIYSITFRERKTENNHTLKVQELINCTGPNANIKKESSPLIQNLILSKTASVDTQGLGFNVSAEKKLLKCDNKEHAGIWVIGSLLKGELWETTAMREIREQSEEVSSSIIG